MNTVQANSLREEAKGWVGGLDGIGLRGELIREIFSTFLLLRWADHQEAEQEAMAVFEDRSFTPVLPAKLHWRHWHALEPMQMGRTVVHELGPRLATLHDSRDIPLATYLHALAEPVRRIADVSFAYLADVVYWLAKQPFETTNDRRQLLEFFDTIVAESSSGYDGQHLSPPSIANIVVALTDPRPGERIYDPCFGSASFLSEAWQYAEKLGETSAQRRGSSLLDVYGIEINPNAYLIGLTRLVLAGVNTPHLELGDSLERDAVQSPIREGFDVVVANPPIGLKMTRDSPRYEHFPIITSDAAGMFIQHALSQLRPKGRAAVVLPEGFLFRRGPEQALRRQLVERGELESVIGLPNGTFLPYTGVRASLLILRKEGGGERVRMVDASEFFEPAKGRRAATVRSARVGQLLEIVKGRHSPHAWDVSRDELDSADWDLTPRRRDKGNLDTVLAAIEDALQGSVKLASLSECAELSPGRSVSAGELVSEPDGERPVSYVRIKDIQNGAASKGSDWVRATALPGIEPRWRLVAGDVLLSKSGTIGKAGIVRNGAVDGIAANGLYVIRVDPGRLDPHFLIAYLASAACQNWLNAQSRGAVIRHLNRAVLEQLPVPLPPLQLQQRAASQHQEFGTDVLEFLAEAAGARQLDRVASWLSSTSQRIPSFIENLDGPPGVSLVEPLIESALAAKRNAEVDEVSSQHMRWLTPLVNGFAGLQGVGQVPEGPSLLNVIQEAERWFRAAAAEAVGHLPIESQARHLADQLADWMYALASALLARASIEITPSVTALRAGTTAEVSVVAENTSTLPLRAVRVDTMPDWGSGSIAFLPEGKSFTVPLHGNAPKVPGLFTLSVRWSGKTLDGQDVNGDLQLPLAIVEGDVAAAEAADLGASPYVTGRLTERTGRSSTGTNSFRRQGGDIRLGSYS